MTLHVENPGLMSTAREATASVTKIEMIPQHGFYEPCIDYIITHISTTVMLLLPATKLWQGNVFTPVWDSVHRGGGSQFRGSLSRWVYVKETPHMVMCEQYASYWNAFLFPK